MDDLISRQAVYEMLDSMLDDSSDNKRNQLVSLDSIADEIAELPSVNPQEPKYCDRNICVSNEYSGIGCDECEVTKSQEPSGEIVKTEESNDNGTKYLNINVSDDEVKRSPDIVRLCSDVGILEYVKPQTDVLDKIRAEIDFHSTTFIHGERYIEKDFALDIIDKYRKEQE